MAMWRAGRQNLYELTEWQKVDAFAMLLRDVCHELDLGRDKAWLLYLLTQASQLMRQAVEESWHREYLAECIFALSEALTFLALIDYYLVFLRHEGYLTGPRAEQVDRQLSDLQDTLTTLTGQLREVLRAHPEGSLSAFPWSRN
jgi:hypothetical protein